jgi:hypothetical protein
MSKKKIIFIGDAISLVGSLFAGVYFLKYTDNSSTAYLCFASALLSVFLLIFKPIERLERYLVSRSLSRAIDQSVD